MVVEPAWVPFFTRFDGSRPLVDVGLVFLPIYLLDWGLLGFGSVYASAPALSVHVVKSLRRAGGFNRFSPGVMFHFCFDSFFNFFILVRG